MIISCLKRFYQFCFIFAPNAPALYNDEGKLNWENGTWENPLADKLKTLKSVNNNLIGNANLNYQVIPGLNIKTALGFNSLTLNAMALFTPLLFYMAPTQIVLAVMLISYYGTIKHGL